MPLVSLPAALPPASLTHLPCMNYTDIMINGSAEPYYGEHRSSERVQVSKIGLEQRVDDPPVSPRHVLDDARAHQQLEHAVSNCRRQSPRNGLASRQRTCDLERVLVEPPDVFDGLLHRREVAVERSVVAQLNHVEIDVAAIELHGDEMCLLGDSHGRARMLRSKFDDPREGRQIDRAVVCREALEQSLGPQLP